MKNGFTVFILLLSALPSLSQRVCMIQGQIVGLNRGKLYLFSSGLLGNAPQLIDSVQLSGEYFLFKRSIDEPRGYSLSMDNTFGQFYFIWDKDLFISLNADDLNQSSVEVSPLNEALKNFSDSVTTIYNRRLNLNRKRFFIAQKEQDTTNIRRFHESYLTLTDTYKAAIRSFIEEHKQNWASLFVLITTHRILGRQLTLDLLEIVNSSIQNSKLAAQLKAKINSSSYPIIP